MNDSIVPIGVYLALAIFSVREFLIRKRVIRIYEKLKKVIPDHSNTPDLAGLSPELKHATTEKIIGKIEARLDKAASSTSLGNSSA